MSGLPTRDDDGDFAAWPDDELEDEDECEPLDPEHLDVFDERDECDYPWDDLRFAAEQCDEEDT